MAWHNSVSIQGAIRSETTEIVEGAFMKVFVVFKLLGKLLIVSGFILHESPGALGVVFLYPVCTVLWLWLRIGFFRACSGSLNSYRP